MLLAFSELGSLPYGPEGENFNIMDAVSMNIRIAFVFFYLFLFILTVCNCFVIVYFTIKILYIRIEPCDEEKKDILIV
uniref:Ion_trans domain-containing protein n=1 Tax=Strongyloides venezuelensis TaxID=75913 RepID=A0A0K0FQS3_STRVS